ncbi:MAG: hypothetical protein ACK5QS_14205 [Pseudanabaenaceae cyanobacterium]
MYWLTKSFPKIASPRRTLSTIGITTFCILGTSFSVGLPAESRYVVFVRGNNPTTLQKIRGIVPTAFITRLPQLPNQPVIQAGAFNQQSVADRLIATLRGRGIASEKLFRGETGKDDPIATGEVNQPTGDDGDNNGENTSGDGTDSAGDTAAIDGSEGQNEGTDGNGADNPDNIEINRPTANNTPQGLPANVVASPNTNNTAPQANQPRTVIPPSQFPARFPVANNCNCQPDSNNLGTVSTVTIAEGGSVGGVNSDAGFRYIAAVPTQGNPQFLLTRVQQLVPDAKLMNSWRGSYVHAGAYPNRDAAESVSRFLRSKGIDSRVLFF